MDPRAVVSTVLGCVVLAATGMGGARMAAKIAQDAHHHKAPRGGVLIELGDEFAHLEIVLDRTAGTLTVFVLDGRAERGVRIAQPVIDVVVEQANRGRIPLQVRAAVNPLTGEREGDSSQFSVTDARLAAPGRLKGTIKDVTVRGQRFADLVFSVP